MKNYVLWSIEPKYLDNFALKACWNDAVSVKNLILSKDNHEILNMFEPGSELEQIKSYMFFLHLEAIRRGLEFESYQIDKNILRFANKIGSIKPITTTIGQLKQDRRVYLGELQKRDRHKFYKLSEQKKFENHLSFSIQ